MVDGGWWMVDGDGPGPHVEISNASVGASAMLAATVTAAGPRLARPAPESF
jgi:hypothetical protein